MAKQTYRSHHQKSGPSKNTQQSVSRRKFLKAGGLTLGALGLGPLVDTVAGSIDAHAATRIGRLNDAAPGFAPLPSSTLLTGAPTDLSIGWDGSTWATDTHGLLHAYDPLRQNWQPFGAGVDAATAFPNGLLFRGAEVWDYVTAQPLQPIGTRWPTLPAAFKLGVDGAIDAAGVVYLFKHGRYVRADMAQPERRLSQLTGWPSAWSDGQVDAYGIGGVNDGKLLLVHGQQYAIADLSAPDMRQHRIVAGPSSLSSVFGPRLLGLLSGGIDTLYMDASASSPGVGAVQVSRGPVTWVFSNSRDAQPQVEPVWGALGGDWPQHWTPQLAHAPSGRAGGLWAATKNGNLVGHNGDSWAQAPAAPGGPAVSAAVDVNGTVYAATAAALHTLAGSAWQPLAQAPGGDTLAQVSAGDDGHVWARASSGQVHRLQDGGALTPIAGLTADHIAAGYDGTLWHADGSANAYRLIAAGSEPSQRLPVAGGGNIQKVATTGYGTSLLLSDTGAAYSYQSPYVFKTATSYWVPPGGSIAQGQNSLFVTHDISLDTSIIVALDAQTGSERWRLPLPNDVSATNPLYDAANQAVIFGDTRGYVTALSAADGHVLWTFQTIRNSRILFDPALNGNLLVFGDIAGKIYAIDTQDAMRRGAAGQPVVTLWTPYQTEVIGSNGEVLTPLLADGQIYTVTGQGANEVVFTQLSAVGKLVFNVKVPVNTNQGSRLVRADIVFERGSPATPAVVINGGTVLCAISLTTRKVKTYAVKNSSGSQNLFTSNLTYHNGVLYVGDFAGYLYALDQTLTPVSNTPVLIDGVGSAIFTQPLVVDDAQGNTTVLVGTMNSAAIWGYQVTAPSPTPVELIGTGNTWINSLSRNSTNGMVYAGGSPQGSSLGQVFGVRIDAEIAAARDFIIESQLMQDFDDPPAGQQAAVAVARYQTALTVVDTVGAPRPFEAVKIWAEQPGTVLSIDGVQHTAGPGDNDCIVTRTDASGKLSIISGSLQGDTDPKRATDLFAVPLRVWAAFMDPFERVVVYPDREFHTRVADTVAGSGAPADPDTINLSTATDYSGPSFKGRALFAANEQQSATQIADVIQTVAGATNLKPQNAARPAAGAAAVQQAGAPDISKYTPDGLHLPGMAYFPTNVRATRAAQALAPVGLSFTSTGGSTISYSKVSVADASAAIDALEGQDWTTHPQLQGSGRQLGGFWSSFWSFIKGVGSAITHIVVSIGKEIYAGIRFVVDGVAYFFKNPLGALEDLVSTIGSFFVKLGKLIKNVVEAISILFNFDQILATQAMLRQIYDGAMSTLQTDIANSIATFNQEFTNLEGQVDATFEKLINELVPPSDPQKPLSRFGGLGQTDHQAFSVGPNGATGPSRTVQCSWAANKMRQHLQAATAPPSAQLGAAPSELAAFIEGFLGSLTTDKTLKNAWESVKTRLDAGLSFRSVEDFFATLVADLLSLLRLVVDAGLAITKALLDGLAKVLESMVGTLQDLGSIEIPVLSSLWRALTGNSLTVVDLVMLIAAIPATVLYRIVEGRYPGDEQATAAAISPQIKRRVMGLGLGCTYIFAGGLTAVLDYYQLVANTVNDPSTIVTPIPLKLLGAMLLLAQVGDVIYKVISSHALSDILLGLFKLLQAVFTIMGAVPKLAGPAISIMNSVFAAVTAILCGLQYYEHKEPDNGLVPISLGDMVTGIVLQVPVLINPLKFIPLDEMIGIIVPLGDLACRGVAGMSTILHTYGTWDQVGAQPQPIPAPAARGHRFLPRIMNER